MAQEGDSDAEDFDKDEILKKEEILARRLMKHEINLQTF